MILPIKKVLIAKKFVMIYKNQWIEEKEFKKKSQE